MSNVMLDLETMGNSARAAIIAIGAVKFDKSGLGSEFYEVVDLQSSVNLGLTMDTSTVLWWMKQGDTARAAFDRKGMPITIALKAFSDWMETDQPVWGNGASFDNVILSTAYRLAGMDQPWKFWNDRCYRTLKSLKPGIKMQRTGTYHNALDDAKSQAEHLMDILGWRK